MATYTTLAQAKASGLKDELVDKLKKLEAIIGPVTYNSAYRSPEYNASVGGVQDSQHMKGLAVDISRASYKETPQQLIDIAVGLGFTGIGIYDGFVHLDARTNPNTDRGYNFWDERKNKSGLVLPNAKKKICSECKRPL
jgi:uncharacterized protein YcbK (DUF882 family)